MIKVLFIVNSDWYFKLHWLNRVQQLIDQNKKIYLLSPITDPSNIEYFKRMGIQCIPLELKRTSINPLSEWRLFCQLRRYMLSINPDIVHCITVKPNVYGGLLALWQERKAIFSITGLGIVFSSAKHYLKVIRVFLLFLYKIVSKNKKCRFIFENEEDWEQFHRSGIVNNQNGLVIYGAGVDTSHYTFSKPPKTRTVLFASRLLKDKGLYHLVEAIQLLKIQEVQVTLVVAGIVDSEGIGIIPIEEIEGWHEKQLIQWVGRSDNIAQLIQESDIVCLPTTYGEGIPRILIEAAASGRSIIATDVVGCRDIVINRLNGILVPVNAPEVIAKAIQELLDNDLLCYQLGENGRKLVLEKFSDQIVLKAFNAVYSNLEML